MQLSNPKLVVSSFLVLLVVGLVKSDLNSGVEDDETSLDSQLGDTSLDQKDDTFNSPPKKHEDKLEEPEGKLQIGIKKKADNCKHRAQKGDTLHMHYRGYLKKDGIEFDNSYKRGQPFTFKLGTGSVIRGWDQGLLGTCAGEKRKLVIPPHLAYGVEGNSGIPPESTLIFEVETIKVESSRGQEL